MLDQTELIKIASGQRQGLLAAVIRCCLSGLTPVYRLAIGLRNRRFDRALANIDRTVVKQVGVPVISVGNLTTGGTGKTPLVIWIAKFLQQQDLRVALISRGYRSANHHGGDRRNDEAIELEQRLPGVPHLQAADRFQISQRAIEEFQSQVIVLDDAFQHRSIHRDLDVVLIDATVPFGFGRLLPRGLLREPLHALRRADLVVLTRADLVDAPQRESILSRIREHVEGRCILETSTVVSGLMQCRGKEAAIERISNQPIYFFCGIGNPLGFQATLKQQGYDIRGSSIFPDHHDFSPEDIRQIGKSAVDCGAMAIVCTHKDLVKVHLDQLNQLPLFALMINIEFRSGQTTMEAELGKLVQKAK